MVTIHAPRPTPENTGEARLHKPSISLAPERSLDLHGYAVDEALDTIHFFFRECRENGTLHVRIITGRGTGEPWKKCSMSSGSRDGYEKLRKESTFLWWCWKLDAQEIYKIHWKHFYEIHMKEERNEEQKKIASFSPIEKRKNIFVGFLVFCVVSTLLAIWSDFKEYKLLEELEKNYSTYAYPVYTDEDIEANDKRQTQISVLFSVAQTTFFVSFLFWFHRAYKNAIFFSETKLRNTPGWAVGHFFIPIVNFFFPYYSAKEIHSSSLTANDNPFGGLIFLWWMLWMVIGNILWRVASIQREQADTLQDFILSDKFYIFVESVDIIGALLTYIIV